MVYASIQTPGTNGYQYGAGIGVVGVALGGGRRTRRSRARCPSLRLRPADVRVPVPESAAGHSTRLDIFDVSGRLIRRLVDAPQSAGSHEQTWTGHDDAGSLVAPGTYSCALSQARRAPPRGSRPPLAPAATDAPDGVSTTTASPRNRRGRRCVLTIPRRNDDLREVTGLRFVRRERGVARLTRRSHDCAPSRPPALLAAFALASTTRATIFTRVLSGPS